MRAVLPRLFVVLLIGVFGARSVTLVSADDSSPSTPTALVPTPADLAHEQITQALAVIWVAELEAQAAAEVLAQAQEIERVEQERLAAEQAEAERAAAEEAQRAQEELRRASIAPQAQRRTTGRWEGCGAPMTADQGEMEAIVRWAAEQYGVSAAQLLRIPPRESGWNPDVQNCSSGACGLFQHLPQYWAGRAEAIGMPGADCRDPRANALAAAMMFASSGFRPWAPSGPY